ncbi:MAG: hybrid sensor histidine kinase/response regulator [Prevotella sp.]|jgi:signal transduction histidine kinase/FixJ family two-component response regulator|nr:hybrid sensor histidine kinase/response regulator [Prevotella sp.]
MDTNRHVKWSKEALDFFESSPNNTIDLDIVISHGCLSQTGGGFKELVDSINYMSGKIRKVSILDTSYLYRHCIHDFARLSDPGTQSIWFLNNKHYIDQLAVKVVMDSWIDKINTDIFKQWYKQITDDFSGIKNGSGIVQDFRNTVISEAKVFVSKKNGTLQECVNFILEERAFSCAFHKNVNLVYPVPFRKSMLDICKKYALNIRQLSYNLSKKLQESQHKYRKNNIAKINQEIITFLTNTLEANFFLIDKFGNYIYKNGSLSEVIGSFTDRVTNLDAWKISKEVMETCKQITVEEKHNGNSFLSVKSPLIVDNRTEGVIGVSINITDRQKAQQLEMQSKLQEERKIIYEQIAHDIRSPLAALSMITKNCKGLAEKEHIALRNIATSIENITSDLLNKYKEDQEKESVESAFSEQYISIYISLLEILNNKRYQYKDMNVTFNFSCDISSNFAFIRGDYSDFCRMTSNIINNSVEALEGRPGIIEVSFTAKNKEVEISIKDNGKGMPKEIADKIMNNIPVGSTKESGYGIGMQQIKNALLKMNGQILIKSTENVGTEVTLIFPESEPPVWVAGQIVLHKGETVVILDDDPSIYSFWENRLKEYSNDIAIKYFTQGSEAIDYIKSSKQKDKILLLTDYELRHQDMNGIDVIERTNMQKQSIVVTSVYTYKIKNFSEKAKFIKLVSKLYVNEIPIVMEENRKTETVDIVFVDDDKVFTQTLSSFVENRGLIAHTYNAPDTFLKNLSAYSKNTKIAIDNELNSEINGIELAMLLHSKKYTNLYLLSGRSFSEGEVPSYLTVIFKGSEDFIEKLL